MCLPHFVTVHHATMLSDSSFPYRERAAGSPLFLGPRQQKRIKIQKVASLFLVPAGAMCRGPRISTVPFRALSLLISRSAFNSSYCSYCFLFIIWYWSSCSGGRRDMGKVGCISGFSCSLFVDPPRVHYWIRNLLAGSRLWMFILITRSNIIFSLHFFILPFGSSALLRRCEDFDEKWEQLLLHTIEGVDRMLKLYDARWWNPPPSGRANT